MSDDIETPGPDGPDFLLARIEANQSPKRQAVSDAIAKVQQIYLKTRYHELLEGEIEVLLDSIGRILTQQKQLNAMPDTREDRAASTKKPKPPKGAHVLIASGEAGAGKTTALAEVFSRRPEFAGFGRLGTGCPLLSVVAPSPFTLKALGNEIVRKLGYHPKREIDEGEVWPMVRLLLREHGVRILHIDEAQHGDQANSDWTKKVEATLKRLLQDVEWYLWLILSGLPEVAKFLQDDKSMYRRIHHVRFEKLVFPDDAPDMRQAVRDLMEPCQDISFEQALTDEFIHRLMHASLYQFGILTEYVQDALEACLQSGEKQLGLGHFADAYSARSGDERDARNVFVAERFDLIDVASSLYETPLDEFGRPVGAKRLKGARTARGASGESCR